jgi:hypothetical protein
MGQRSTVSRKRKPCSKDRNDVQNIVMQKHQFFILRHCTGGTKGSFKKLL